MEFAPNPFLVTRRSRSASQRARKNAIRVGTSLVVALIDQVSDLHPRGLRETVQCVVTCTVLHCWRMQIFARPLVKNGRSELNSGASTMKSPDHEGSSSDWQKRSLLAAKSPVK